MRFGRGRSFTQQLLAPAGDAPEGGGGAPPAGAGGQPAGAPAGAGPTQEQIAELMKNPAVLAEMAKQSKAAADAATAATEARVKAALAEEQRLAQLGVEERAKVEAAAAKGLATKAANEAATARAELAFSRQLQRAKLVPASEIAESMARTVAQEYAGEGQPITEEHVARVKAEHAYLFASTGGAPASNPAAVAAAGTLSTTPATGSGAPPPGSGSAPRNANDMTREEFQAEVERMSRSRR